jgi:hypothetical protein
MSLYPAGSPNGPDRYGYCGGDPVNCTDPMGTKIVFRDDESVFEGQLIGYSGRKLAVCLAMQDPKKKDVFYFDNAQDMDKKLDQNLEYYAARVGLDEQKPVVHPPSEAVQFVKGDFNKEGSTTGGVVANSIVPFVPVAGQIAGARDTVAAIGDFYDEPTWSGSGRVTLNALSILPVIGYFTKAEKATVAATKAVARVERIVAAEASSASAQAHVLLQAEILETNGIKVQQILSNADIIADIKTSKMGRLVLEAAEKDKINLSFIERGASFNGSPILGEATALEAIVYKGSHATVESAAGTAIHEGLHAMGISGSQSAELLVRIAQAAHQHRYLNRQQIRALKDAISVHPLYRDLPRDLGRTSELFPGRTY